MKITREPIGEQYHMLIDFISTNCDQFFLVERDDMDVEENARLLKKELQPNLLAIKNQSAWIGTKLLNGQTAKVHYYYLTENTKQILKKYASSLYSWTQPELLEDLTFLKNNNPWFVTVGHEKFAYFEENSPEIEEALNELKIPLTPRRRNS